MNGSFKKSKGAGIKYKRKHSIYRMQGRKSQYKSCNNMVTWMRMACIGSYLNAWSQVNGAVGEEFGDVALLEEMFHWNGLWFLKRPCYS